MFVRFFGWRRRRWMEASVEVDEGLGLVIRIKIMNKVRPMIQ